MGRISRAGLKLRQRGLSIVEIMIALLLGTLLTFGVVQIFTSNSQTFRLTDADARAQEAGRTAVDILSRALRNAGYFGCFPVNGIHNNLDTTDSDYSAALHDIRSEGIYAHSSVRPAAALANTDFFLVSGARSNGTSIAVTAETTNAASIPLSTQGGLARGDIVMVSDCSHGDIIEISNLQGSGGSITLVADTSDGTPGNDFTGNSPAGCSAAGSCLSARYGTDARVMPVYNETYYIASSGGNTGLYLRDSTGAAAELVSGIVNMRVRYGRGTAETGVQNWVEAASVSDWSEVIAAQVSLLVQAGSDNLLPEAQQYCFPGWQNCDGATVAFTTAPDRRLYRVYTFTASLRNRI